MLGAIAAIVTILHYFGINPNFSPHVNYREAGNFKPNFEQAEEKSRRNDLQIFTGVSHSPHDRDEAVLVASSTRPSENPSTEAQLINKYGDYHTVTLDGIEPGVVNAATQHLVENYQLSGRDFPLAL